MKEKVKTLFKYFLVYLFIAFLAANGQGVLGDQPPVTDWRGGFNFATIIAILYITYSFGKDMGIREKRQNEKT